ncbi:MAG: hypothetical protein ABIA67_04690 [Candidatus Margulisiibacteriota bacterium]
MRVTSAESCGRQLAKQINRANLMFAAYRYDLSSEGERLAAVTSQAQQKIAAEKFDVVEVNQIRQEVLAAWPDPSGADLLTSAWLGWFKVDDVTESLNDPIGQGCLEPCSFCERGNIDGWVHDDPLYVIAARVKKAFALAKSVNSPLFFQGTFANNVIEWFDPLLNFDIGSLAASFAKLDCEVVFSSIIKAFNPEDQCMLAAAQRFASVSSPNFIARLALSFHLGIGSPDHDIIRAICDAREKRIPDSIIDRYAQRYGENFKIIGPMIYKVFLYGSGFGIRDGELGDDITVDKNNSSDVFNWATKQALLRALNYAGIEVNNLPFALTLFDRRPLHHAGRGFDFFRRLDKAFYEGQYLEPDQGCNQDFKPKPTPHTRVARKADGTIIVRNPHEPTEILVQTTLDELGPIAVY